MAEDDLDERALARHVVEGRGGRIPLLANARASRVLVVRREGADDPWRLAGSLPVRARRSTLYQSEKWCVIFNPVAARGRAERRARELQAALAADSPVASGYVREDFDRPEIRWQTVEGELDLVFAKLKAESVQVRIVVRVRT